MFEKREIQLCRHNKPKELCFICMRYPVKLATKPYKINQMFTINITEKNKCIHGKYGVYYEVVKIIKE